MQWLKQSKEDDSNLPANIRARCTLGAPEGEGAQARQAAPLGEPLGVRLHGPGRSAPGRPSLRNRGNGHTRAGRQGWRAFTMVILTT